MPLNITLICVHDLVCRSRLYSTSSDGYGYDTSDYCTSSIPSNSNSGSLTRSMEQKLGGLPRRSANVQSENNLRDTSDFHLGDSILGQVSCFFRTGGWFFGLTTSDI